MTRVLSQVGYALISNKNKPSQRIKALQFCKAFFLLGFIQFCISCEAYFFNPSNHIDDLATKNGWERYSAKHKSLTLAGYFKPILDTSDVLHVYIEGDGAPWLYPWLPPENPTPFSPISLQLALNDPHPNILYLARPCQLTRGSERHGCHVDLWSNARFSPVVIETTNSVISTFLNTIKANKVVLFGYSGGGSVATLVAAIRDDIIGIITIAATIKGVGFAAIA